LRSNGTVVAWGSNLSGQTNVPPSLTNAVRISAGFNHSLALRSDGTVVSWGAALAVPTNLTGVVAIAAGYGLSMALKSDGTVVTWDSALKSATVPAGLNNVVAISSVAASSQNYGGHNLALKSDGTIVAWGNNASSQELVPSELVSAVQPACGAGFSLALLNDRSPAFTVQPWHRPVVAGSNVTLTAFAAGKLPLQYQWRLNGADLPGATTTSLALTNVSPAQAGDYALVAANEFGVSTSAVATLSVTIPQPLLKSFGAVSNGFSFTFTSIAGVIYVVEFKDDLTAMTWTELERRLGVGGLEIVTDLGAPIARRFYRVRALYAPSPKLGATTWTGGAVNFNLPTVAGANYIVQFKTNLNASVWQDLFRQTSTGAPIVINDPTTNGPSRFYRVKVE
jgi:hypothetical protein